jgi:hypothetical protein
MSKQLDDALEILSARPLPDDAEERIEDLMDEAPEDERFEFQMIFEGLELITRELTPEELEQET